MFLEEKIELLKRGFSSKEFRIPFNDFRQILKNIEAKFIVKGNPNIQFNNWLDNLKNVNSSHFLTEELLEFLNKTLNSDKNYWWVMVEGREEVGKHKIYDANLKAGKALINVFSDLPFFIIDKKYKWMMAIDRERRIVYILA